MNVRFAHRREATVSGKDYKLSASKLELCSSVWLKNVKECEKRGGANILVVEQQNNERQSIKKLDKKNKI